MHGSWTWSCHFLEDKHTFGAFWWGMILNHHCIKYLGGCYGLVGCALSITVTSGIKYPLAISTVDFPRSLSIYCKNCMLFFFVRIFTYIWLKNTGRKTKIQPMWHCWMKALEWPHAQSGPKWIRIRAHDKDEGSLTKTISFNSSSQVSCRISSLQRFSIYWCPSRCTACTTQISSVR